ncbi:MAG: hypothetical protein PHY87_06445 [Sphaerochaeta sp.]|nr:hypothetical protein [uncultured Sphaerochaeta sp.]MDD3058631.1 hypothetical protein [Sphaerochaeta sp.]MDD3929415.1 hypothetical protein [Sphaerochaeta sp.]
MKRMLLVCVLMLTLAVAILPARDQKIAVGGQIGFAASGVVVDIGLGSLYLQAGVNYPLGVSYIASALEAEDVFYDIVTFNADISQAFALSENFDLKLGIGTTAFSNFGPVVLGLGGVVLKGEYWIPNQNYGLFLNLNIPILAYGFIEDDDNFDGGVVFNPLLPLAGLLTSTVGVLYTF